MNLKIDQTASFPKKTKTSMGQNKVKDMHPGKKVSSNRKREEAPFVEDIT